MRSILPIFALSLAVSAPALATELIPVPTFRSIELHGGGEVIVRRGPGQRVTLAQGSSQFTRVRVLSEGRLRIDACNERCPQHYRLQIVIDSPTVPVLAVAGGGTIDVAAGFPGQATLTVAVNGGGAVDTTRMSADAVTAAIHGGGEIRVRARRALTAAVSGGGMVRYWGDPAVTSAVKGGGLVRRY